MANQSNANPLSGEVDSSFGVDGTVRLTKSGGVVSNARGITEDGTGRLLLAGTFSIGSAEHYAVIRLTPDGVQDPTFGAQGVVVGNFIKNKDARANSVIITEDNKVLLSGTSGAKTAAGAPVDVFMGGIARFDQAGVLDHSFGSGGHISLYVRHPLSDSTSVQGAYDVNSDIVTASLSSVAKNKIFYTWSANTRAIWGQLVFSYSVLGRLATDGLSDGSFQKGGHVYISLPEEFVRITMIQRHLVVEGQVIVAGHVLVDSGPNKGFLRRYDLNGNVDTTFGDSTLSDGFVFALPVDDARPVITKTLVRHESTLLLVGNSNGQGVIAAFTLNGDVDQSFNQGELLSADLPGSNGTVTWLDAASSDGGILALGHIDEPEAGNFVIARYLSSGVLDARFGAGKGWILSAPDVELKALVVQRRAGGLPNRILVTGVVGKGEYAVVMAFLDI